MDESRFGQRVYSSINGQRVYLLDYRRGDVTGDGVPDNIYLYGNKPDGAAGLYAENISLVIQDGRYSHSKAVTPAGNAGFNGRLFLGDFDGDGTDDIKITLESGPGTSGIACSVYSFKKHVLRELFSAQSYNTRIRPQVNYLDYYRVSIGCASYGRQYVLDLSTRKDDYLSLLYGQDGRLTRPFQGGVLPLSAAVPIVGDELDGSYNLLARQRVTGLSDVDTLGEIESILAWDGQSFVPKSLTVSIDGIPAAPF